MSLNVVALVGRLCSEPEMKYTGSGTAIGNFRIAVDRQRKAEGQPEADFLDVVTFGKTAEFVSQYLDKGAKVAIAGRIQSRNWETKDGQKRVSVEVVADSVQALESRAEAEARRGGAGAQGGSQVPAATNAQHRPATAAQAAPARGAIGEDEDPFGDQ